MKNIVLLLITLTVSSCNEGNERQSACFIGLKLKPENVTTTPKDSIINKPLLVWSSESQLNASVINPVIFYSPHQDDETIGMGASIAEHVRLGRPVYVVLLTNGANPGMLAYMKTFNQKATMQNVISARNNEFMAACFALGVHRIYIANAGKGFDECLSFLTLKNNFKSTMSYMCHLFPKASHKTISGNCDSYNKNCNKMPAHQATATAIHELYNNKLITDIRLYRIYFYYHNYGTCDRASSWIKPVNADDMTRRQQAINEYKYVNESIQRYGMGYRHSVQPLFDNSWESNCEYIDFIENDY